MPTRSSRAWMVAGCLVSSGLLVSPAVAQPKAPSLSKAQRAALEAVVRAVDGGRLVTPVAAEWQTHVLRASDGSHYVALRAVGADAPVPTTPVVLYVRLATHRDERTLATERSVVREWLQGERSDPRPPRLGGSMAVPRGEMPAGTIATRDPAADNVAALRLMALERERERQRREAAEAKRRTDLENATRPRSTDMLPFEDFDVDARFLRRTGGGVDIRRSLAAGPGDYDVVIAWTLPGASPASVVYEMRHRLRLPAASADFALSDLIVADTVTSVSGAYPAAQQNAHPYATGAIEVGPALRNTLAADGTLGLVVQVINPVGDLAGKPSVTVDFRIARLLTTGAEAPVGVLPTQRFDDTRLPSDFDAAKGHPLFAAVRASLASFSRGRYRVTATAQDLLSGRTAVSEAIFDVVGTPASLLREAPRPGQPFRRDAALTAMVRQALVNAVAPPQPSPALAASLAAAAAGHYATLLRDDLVPLAERPVALALRALALYGLGDAARTVAVQLQSAVAQGVPAASLSLLEGAVYALAGDDAAAIATWERNTEAGPTPAAATLLVDAYLRRRDVSRALRVAEAALAAEPGNLFATRTLAAIHLAENRVPEALALARTTPLATSLDLESRFLRLHALFAAIVAVPAGADAGAIATEFEMLAASYVAEAGPHAALVAEWQRVAPRRDSSGR